MAEEGRVKLHGAWPSPFVYRVIWALKLKDIPYEYIEEDLSNKSPLLLQYNPIHKKIPILVHDGKPVIESMIIVEYIDEKWPHKYPLVPSDPHARALARFWVKFIEDKCGPAVWTVARTNGEEQEKAKKESLEAFRSIEEHCKLDYDGGEKITGIVEIALGAVMHWVGAIEELVEVKLIEADTFPRLHAWARNFSHRAVIKDNLPDPDEILAFLKPRREALLASSSSA